MDAEALGFFKDTTAQDPERLGQQDEETNRGFAPNGEHMIIYYAV
jgi:hypothetical protein